MNVILWRTPNEYNLDGIWGPNLLAKNILMTKVDEFF